MNRARQLITGAAIPFLVMMLMSGCKQSPEEQPVAEKPIIQVKDLPALTADAPAHTQTVTPLDVAPPSADKPAAANAAADKVTLSSSSGGADIPADKPPEPAKPATSGKPKVDVQETYTVAKPILMGLTLKTSASDVVKKFGNPREQFLMDDEIDPMTVYDYTDFMVGFNKAEQLMFVDVRSSEINPGLNGLKLGQTTDDAYKALGKPDTNTSYVLTYKSEGTVLKLDVDPKTKTINSIKLFYDK
ncbi:DUF4309 domain-containing protein [Paenibacillus thalictri]|nr:DUF4309 domain-containing protein [Paenibacillus thalictri]